MTRRALLLLVAMAATGCAPVGLCDDLEEALSLCDLRVRDLGACEAWPGAQTELKARLDDEGCAALRDDEGVVDETACATFGWDCPGALIDAQEKRPRYPVLFVSGIDDTPVFDWAPRVLDAVERRNQAEVGYVGLPAWESREVRAASLWQQVQNHLAQRGAEKVNLVCWAVGGLDCRYLTSPEGLFKDEFNTFALVESRIASVTTIATPHKGTNLADVLLALPAGEMTNTAFAMAGGPDGTTREEREELVRDALAEITLDRGAVFDATITATTSIYRQSWAGVSQATKEVTFSDEVLDAWCTASNGEVHLLRGEHTMDDASEFLVPLMPYAEVADTEDARLRSPADGEIAVHSARWANFRGCVVADHYDLVGRMADAGRDPNTGFDAADFYVDLVSDLADRGH